MSHHCERGVRVSTRLHEAGVLHCVLLGRVRHGRAPFELPVRPRREQANLYHDPSARERSHRNSAELVRALELAATSHSAKSFTECDIQLLLVGSRGGHDDRFSSRHVLRLVFGGAHERRCGGERSSAFGVVVAGRARAVLLVSPLGVRVPLHQRAAHVVPHAGGVH